MIKYRKGLADLPTYNVTERDWRIKINANESTLNLPPLVEERVMARLSHVAFNRYPTDEEESLKEQIADNYSLETSNILLGNGSSEIIEKLFFAFGGGRHKIVFPQPSFSMYEIYARLADAEGVSVALTKDYKFDADAFIKAVKDSRAAFAVICNPNNPTGTAIPLTDIEHVVKSIDCPILIDEAYMEFFDQSAVSLMEKYPLVMIARTFSKAYALASARVGYLLASEELTKMLGKVFLPYHLNVLSCVTADIVYQMRHEFAPLIKMFVEERKRISDELSKLKSITVYPSETNFVLIKTDKATALNEYLEACAIGVRSFKSASMLENCLRITAGTAEENEILLKEIKKFLEER